MSDKDRKEHGSVLGLTVVLPTLNEAEAIERVIEELLEAGVPRESILVVDGGSTDGTVEKAKRLGVRIIRQRGKGKAGAVRTGLEEAETDLVLFMDADCTYPAQPIHDMVRAAREECLDEVIGARVWGPETQSIIFRVGNRLLTRLFNLLFNTSLTDVLSGMYLVRKSALRDAHFTSRHFGIESEIVAHIASTSGRIREIPITYRARCGEKKLRPWHGVMIALDMLRLAWAYNPAFVIFAVGALLLLAPGLALSASVLYRMIFLGAKHYVEALIAAILTSSGILSLLLAVQALFMKRMEFRLRRTIEAVAKMRGEC